MIYVIERWLFKLNLFEIPTSITPDLTSKQNAIFQFHPIIAGAIVSRIKG